MTLEKTTLQEMGVTSIRVREIHRTDAIGDTDTTELLERHKRGDWGEVGIAVPGGNEKSIRNFHEYSIVMSEYREEPKDQSIMIYTVLWTGRTVIFRKSDMTEVFVLSYLWEMLMGDPEPIF